MEAQIRKLTTSFEDAKIEAEYQHDEFVRTVRPLTRFSVAFTMIVFLAYAAHDIAASVSRISSAISIRIGIHTGPVVAGVIGKKKFIYDVWGDTVNTASRMKSHALPGSIQVTGETARQLEKSFEPTLRGEIDVKGKGVMKTWFLEGRKAN